MTNNEVNKVIAEYMGYEYADTETARECDGCDMTYFTVIKDRRILHTRPYTNSLDALVPVWDRLRYTPDFSRRTGRKGWVCSGKQSQLTDIYGRADTIQEAAAHATAKAILALGGEND